MIDIATPEDFTVEDSPIYASAEIGVFSFTVLATMLIVVALLVEWSAQGTGFWRSVAFAVTYGVVFGLVVAGAGFIIERGKMQREADRSLRRFFAADPVLVPQAPLDATERLFCAVLLERGCFAGGVLYVQPRGLLFQPHFPRQRRFRRASRVVPDGIAIGPARTIILQQGSLLPRPWWRQPLLRRPIPVLVCTWDGGGLALRVPRLPLVQARLQASLDRVRAAGAV